jgi:hypothetical protein
MKTKFLTFLLICFFTNLITAQKVIKPADLKTINIANFLKNKGYTILEQDETYVKIVDSDNNHLYLDIDPSNKFIAMSIKISLKENVKKNKVDALVAKINDLSMLSAKDMDDNSVYFKYDFWMTHGFTFETLEDAIMEFFLYQGDSYALDEEKLFDY